MLSHYKFLLLYHSGKLNKSSTIEKKENKTPDAVNSSKEKKLFSTSLANISAIVGKHKNIWIKKINYRIYIIESKENKNSLKKNKF